MELRQLRYFVVLAEELHFGRAAAREHIVQSAMSQQLQHLERELGVLLLDRTTHRVQITPAGRAFLVEARNILARVDRATSAAHRAASSVPTLRVGVVDASYDTMPQILRRVQDRYPDLAIHQVEAGVPEQLRLLVEGRLDAGLGRASLAPAEVASQLVRLDPLGVFVPEGHRLAASGSVPVATLAREPLLLARQDRAPEFNQFVNELCRSVGFTPVVHPGTVDSMNAGLDLVAQGRCLLCVPASCASAVRPGVAWRRLVEPVSEYPWSVLWRAGDLSEHVGALVAFARALSRQLQWLPPRQPAAG
jgi:DNA-binding transcriptional LysR family regulator